MEPVTEPQIRRAFVNLTKGQASRLNLPADLAERPWDDLDFLGWHDPKAPTRAYLVTDLASPQGEGLRGVAMRRSDNTVGRPRKAMCDLCLTVGPVALMVAPRAGKEGQRGGSVGSYLCSDLGCSLYARGRRVAGVTVLQETLTVEQKVERLRTNLDAFIGRVLR